MAYISEALRHFLIFHERFYGAPNFLRLFNRAAATLCRPFPVLAPIINSVIISLDAIQKNLVSREKRKSHIESTTKSYSLSHPVF
ncbi:hypothetical protein PUN28_009192 [Cardiocondyla obscurior]|uniref:Uncharacterized protein n=1 Tax=Cardiocondyla obscurior TaxID=286306 RepID=A0AAW2FTA5_9HYME